MTNTETPDFPALAAQVEAIAADLAENLPDDLFSCFEDGYELRGRYAAVVKRASAWRGGALYRTRPYSLVVSVEGIDADRWGYVAGYIADRVKLPQEVVDRPAGPTEPIIDDLGPGVCALSW